MSKYFFISGNLIKYDGLKVVMSGKVLLFKIAAFTYLSLEIFVFKPVTDSIAVLPIKSNFRIDD